MTPTETKPVFAITMHNKETDAYIRLFNVYFSSKICAYDMAETIEKERQVTCYVHELV